MNTEQTDNKEKVSTLQKARKIYIRIMYVLCIILLILWLYLKFSQVGEEFEKEQQGVVIEEPEDDEIKALKNKIIHDALDNLWLSFLVTIGFYVFVQNESNRKNDTKYCETRIYVFLIFFLCFFS